MKAHRLTKCRCLFFAFTGTRKDTSVCACVDGATQLSHSGERDTLRKNTITACRRGGSDEAKHTHTQNETKRKKCNVGEGAWQNKKKRLGGGGRRGWREERKTHNATGKTWSSNVYNFSFFSRQTDNNANNIYIYICIELSRQ